MLSLAMLVLVQFALPHRAFIGVGKLRGGFLWFVSNSNLYQ